MKLVARVPATSANLGPGFDCLGLALGLHNEVTLEMGAPFDVEIEGEGSAELARDRSNLIYRSMQRVAESQGSELPEFSLRCINRIPLERGLGSSSAAVVAGMVLADRLTGARLSDDELLDLAVDVEGHADNVAPALRGGFTLAYDDGGWRAESLPLSESIRPVVLVPLTERMPTAEARRVLPDQVAREDAVFNASRAALVVVALGGRPELLFSALDDRLHQPVRLPLVPRAHEVFSRLRGLDVPVCLSGAGPSLIAFESDGVLVPDLGDDWAVLRLAPDLRGAVVSES